VTSVARGVNVEVSVADAFSPAADALADVSPALATLEAVAG